MRGVQRFTDLRAWQTSYTYKRAVYRLCCNPPLSLDKRLRDQLEDSVAGPPAHIAEGYGRFNPLDFARFTVIARSSLMESQNHLLDAVDRGHITEEERIELNAMAEEALREVTGLMEYLQSPEALRNARRARERRTSSRPERLSKRAPRPTVPDQENSNQAEPQPPNSPNPEPNPETRTRPSTPRAENPNREPEP